MTASSNGGGSVNNMPAAVAAAAATAAAGSNNGTTTPAVTHPVTPVAKLAHKVGFIGGGQMALALAKGFMQAGLIGPSQVLTSAPSDANLIHWRGLGAATTHSNAEVVLHCDVIFLATKPHIFPAVMAGLEIDSIEDDPATAKKVADAAEDAGATSVLSPQSRYLTVDSKLYISIMAGITIKSLTNALSNITISPRVIRTHPNTPASPTCSSTCGSRASRCDPCVR